MKLQHCDTSPGHLSVTIANHADGLPPNSYPEATMSETIFCYCCRVHHPSEQMQRFRTRFGFRWRCRSSIEAARWSTKQRDAFGRQQSALNRDIAQSIPKPAFLPIDERRLQR